MSTPGALAFCTVLCCVSVLLSLLTNRSKGADLTSSLSHSQLLLFVASSKFLDGILLDEYLTQAQLPECRLTIPDTTVAV